MMEQLTDILQQSEDELLHYGTPRHSGRYPWGSGKNPQRNKNFLARAEELKKQGLSDTEVAKMMGLSTTQYRAMKSIAKHEQRAANHAQAARLKETGMSYAAIAREMGVPESSVRAMLKEEYAERADAVTNVANMLKEQVADKTYLDIGVGVERQLGITQTRLDTAVAMLQEQGYTKHYIKVEQAGNPGKYTSVQVLTKDDIPWAQVNENRDQIMSPQGVYSDDGGASILGIKRPVSIDSDRIQICYKEDGGIEKDGLIELRPGVPDISLGDSRYAQVRIAVDDTHYLKGMAVYSKNLPDGVDIRFNTNKDSSVDKMKVLKEMNTVKETGEVDWDNPFGASIHKQREWTDEKGEKHQSAINIVNEDQDWAKWSKTLSSQMLSKQSPALAKQQLDIKYDQKKQEYDEIMSLTNPVLKRHLLESFADGCDSDSVHLQAAALPRQSTKVLIPMTSLKDTEVFAPTYKDGEQVALIRYPHGGTFEIPVLTVNNKNREGRDILTTKAEHAIGINSKVAEQLSGADFDGDTVTVIPIAGQKIRATSPLPQLKGFDPKIEYRAYEGMPKTGKDTGFQKQAEMGKVSNLITDMTIKGATEPEIARAVKHSMVVIDAEKHNLNWRQSYVDNGIAELKEKYQGGANRGAATLISQAKSQATVHARKDNYTIDPETGKKIWQETGETYKKTRTLKSGEERTSIITRTERSTRMAEADDAFELSSGTRIEAVYATHANKLKALANDARKAFVSTAVPSRNSTAAKEYKAEVDSLEAKLNIALKNAPNERKAQLVASKVIEAKIADNPDLKDKSEKEHLTRLKNQAIAAARVRAGSVSRNDRNISITDREWEAIQAGAVSSSKLSLIFKNTDLDVLKERAMPRTTAAVSSTKLSRAKALLDRGYTWAEVSDAVGVSVSTLEKEIGAKAE